ncbi:glycosyltransferase [Parasphingorhabdus sp.]|uniref:glycosyltransferase n=1 Tax=Parasphingorhabdus sp. TaxID=2709688 RepID=UPI0032671C0D
MADQYSTEASQAHMVDLTSRVGVVVIGRNEGQRLIKCLESLAPSDCPIIYVDSASTDGSPAAAQSRGAIVHPLDLGKPFTAARARNEGFAKLKDVDSDVTYVLFVDGDCEVEPDWIATAARFLNENINVAAVCGRRKERFPDASIYNQLCDREWNTPIGESAACGGDVLMRVDSFEAAGGYDSTMIAGEEPELCGRLRDQGLKIWRIDAPMTVHDAAMLHFRQWWLRAVRSGFGYAQVWATSRSTSDPLYGREIFRALFWALALPLGGLIAGLFNPIFWLLLPVIYLVQICRMAIRSGPGQIISWQAALLMMVGKFGELAGIFRFAKRTLQKQQGGTIFYK